MQHLNFNEFSSTSQDNASNSSPASMERGPEGEEGGYGYGYGNGDGKGDGSRDLYLGEINLDCEAHISFGRWSTNS